MAKKQSKVGEKFANAFGKGSSEAGVDWNAASANLVHQLVSVVTAAGGAISFGKTGNGSAFTLYFLHDDIPKDKRRFVLGGEETVDEDLRYWIQFWEE